MEHHFYLPQLTEENIATPNKYGQWFNNDRKIILGISDGIIVDENAITKGVSSIPDIWARPLLFHSAIRENSKHPLRKRCVQEWRGLMSLLALHKINPDLANLVVEPVGLDSGRFSTALRNLLPNSVQLEDGIYYEWNHILMIKFEDIPIGAFSPSTLVYTGSDYNKKLIKVKKNSKFVNTELAIKKLQITITLQRFSFGLHSHKFDGGLRYRRLVSLHDLHE